MKKILLIFVTSLLFFGCTEKSRIDSLAEKRDDAKLFEKLSDKMEEKDTVNLAYLCDKIVQADLPDSKNHIEDFVLAERFDYKIEDQVIKSFEAYKRSFRTPQVTFDLVVKALSENISYSSHKEGTPLPENYQKVKNFRLLKTHPKEKTQFLVEEQISKWIAVLSDSINSKLKEANITLNEIKRISELTKLHNEFYSSEIMYKYINLYSILDSIQQTKVGIVTIDLPKPPELNNPIYVAPDVREPVYDPPRYRGVVPFTAAYVGPLYGKYGTIGIIIRMGSSYFVVDGGAEPRYGVTILTGYAEGTGRDIDITLRGYPITCKVIRLSDASQYAMSQAVYQAKLQVAQENYNSEVANVQRKIQEAQSSYQSRIISEQIRFAEATKKYNEDMKKYNENEEKNKISVLRLKKLIKEASDLFASN